MNKSPFNHEIKYVLIDWHGVVGNRGFWCEQSRKDTAISLFCNFFFKDDLLVKRWMTDDLTTDELMSLAYSKFGIYKDVLIQAFQEDVREYGPRMNILNWITEMFPTSTKILFSENPTLFKEYVLKPNEYLNKYFQHVFLSCDYGVLKIDNNETLFEKIPEKLGTTSFEDFVLIDDKYKNCASFVKLGGHYINFM